jgi:DNA modification methylase
MERIVLASSNENEIVLDFFAGTGSTLVAAKMHGRKFIGCDSEANFVEIAKARLKLIK